MGLNEASECERHHQRGGRQHECIQAEWEANAPLHEAMAIKRERWRVLRAKRAAKQR